MNLKIGSRLKVINKEDENLFIGQILVISKINESSTTFNAESTRGYNFNLENIKGYEPDSNYYAMFELQPEHLVSVGDSVRCIKHVNSFFLVGKTYRVLSINLNNNAILILSDENIRIELNLKTSKNEFRNFEDYFIVVETTQKEKEIMENKFNEAFIKDGKKVLANKLLAPDAVGLIRLGQSCIEWLDDNIFYEEIPHDMTYNEARMICYEEFKTVYEQHQDALQDKLCEEHDTEQRRLAYEKGKKEFGKGAK